MADRLEELQSAVRDLTGDLRRLEARVRQLEGEREGAARPRGPRGTRSRRSPGSRCPRAP